MKVPASARATRPAVMRGARVVRDSPVVTPIVVPRDPFLEAPRIPREILETVDALRARGVPMGLVRVMVHLLRCNEGNLPARAMIGVADLGPGVKLELVATAAVAE